MINLTVAKIAEFLNAEVIGDSSLLIKNIQPIEKAGESELSFYYHDKYEEYFKNSKASCLIISNSNNTLPQPNQAFIRVEKPYQSFVKLLKYIESMNPKVKSGIHSSVIIGDGCDIASNVHIGANCVIGSNSILSDGVVLKPGVILYDKVKIGTNTIINSNVVLYQGVEIGRNCIIHAGAVIGADGFGYVENPEDGSYDKVPQLGNVILEDDVEIGANTTIDCALVGSTRIRRGSKIDNLVHIAHNCDIGENTGIAAQTGISGSVVSGNRNRFGGQVGIAGHLEIPGGVTILAQSGVAKTIPKSGVYFGSPIKEQMQAFKIEAVMRRLPELSHDVNDLKNTVKKISEKLGD